MIKIALCGANGKMCRVVYNLLKEREGCTVVCGFDLYNTNAYASFDIYENLDEYKDEIDVMIDFSSVAKLNERLEYCIKNNIALVVATTGLDEEQINQVKNAAKKIPIFFTYNMSMGINLLADLAKRASAVLGGYFDIEIIEKHHNQKIDAPSGTAFMLANAINEVENDKYKYMYDRHSIRHKRDKNEIGIHAVRGGTIVGEHEIIFAGHDEVITLSHSANSKEVFAVGACNAAFYINGLKPSIYTMEDLLGKV